MNEKRSRPSSRSRSYTWRTCAASSGRCDSACRRRGDGSCSRRAKPRRLAWTGFSPHHERRNRFGERRHVVGMSETPTIARGRCIPPGRGPVVHGRSVLTSTPRHRQSLHELPVDPIRRAAGAVPQPRKYCSANRKGRLTLLSPLVFCYRCRPFSRHETQPQAEYRSIRK